jgi:hypothetical protein
MIINIYFNKKELDFSNLRKYENLSLNLYSQVNYGKLFSHLAQNSITLKI